MYIEVELYYRGFRLKTLNGINNKIHYNQWVHDVIIVYIYSGMNIFKLDFKK